MSCAKRDPLPLPDENLSLIYQAAEAHERLFVSAGGRGHSCVDLSVLKGDSLLDRDLPCSLRSQ